MAPITEWDVEQKLSDYDFERYSCCDCCSCQDYPKSPIDQKVEVLNRKYCWLYPRYPKKKLRPPPPEEDPDAPKYSKCDHQLETCVQEQLLSLEHYLKRHTNFVNKQFDLQRAWVKTLFSLSYKYKIINEMGVCIKLYPESVSKPAESSYICSFFDIKDKICKSNVYMGISLKRIKRNIMELDKRCGRLDYRLDTPFIAGSNGQSSLKNVRHLIDDLYIFYSEKLLKLLKWARALDPGDPFSVEDYSAIIAPVGEFKCKAVLMEQLQNCKCFRGAVLTLKPTNTC